MYILFSSHITGDCRAKQSRKRSLIASFEVQAHVKGQGAVLLKKFLDPSSRYQGIDPVEYKYTPFLHGKLLLGH